MKEDLIMAKELGYPGAVIGLLKKMDILIWKELQN